MKVSVRELVDAMNKDVADMRYKLRKIYVSKIAGCVRGVTDDDLVSAVVQALNSTSRAHEAAVKCLAVYFEAAERAEDIPEDIRKAAQIITEAERARLADARRTKQ